MSESTPTVELWEYDRDRERLRPFKSPHEAIDDWFDTFWIPYDSDGKLNPQCDWPIPCKKVCYGYARMSIPRPDPKNILEYILEHLGEEYGDPDNYDWGMTPTDGMTKAAEALADVVAAEYKAWMMEQVAIWTVDVVEWARENAADVFDRIEWQKEKP